MAAYLHDIADVLDFGGEVGVRAPFLTTDKELWWSFPEDTGLNGDPLTPAPTSKTS
ncbi:hypothetical protein ABIA33_004941 [Streptacidiphilus sp. MAP12-16]